MPFLELFIGSGSGCLGWFTSELLQGDADLFAATLARSLCLTVAEVGERERVAALVVVKHGVDRALVVSVVPVKHDLLNMQAVLGLAATGEVDAGEVSGPRDVHVEGVDGA